MKSRILIRKNANDVSRDSSRYEGTCTIRGREVINDGACGINTCMVIIASFIFVFLESQYRPTEGGAGKMRLQNLTCCIYECCCTIIQCVPLGLKFSLHLA